MPAPRREVPGVPAPGACAGAGGGPAGDRGVGAARGAGATGRAGGGGVYGRFARSGVQSLLHREVTRGRGERTAPEANAQRQVAAPASLNRRYHLPFRVRALPHLLTLHHSIPFRSGKPEKTGRMCRAASVARWGGLASEKGTSERGPAAEPDCFS